MAKKRYKCACGRGYASRMRRGKLTKRYYCSKPCMRMHEAMKDAELQLKELAETDLGDVDYMTLNETRTDSPFMPIKKKGMAKIKFLEDAFFEGQTFPQHYIHTPE